MSIRCVAFDLDDTLWDCRPVIEQAEREFYIWLKQNYPRIPDTYTAKELVEKRVSYMQNYPELHYNLTRLRKNWLAALASEHGYNDDMVEPGFDVFWQARNAVTFFEGTLEILQTLSNKFIMGVISNGNASVDHIGVGHLFQFVHSAAEAGVAKPHPAIFQQALAKVGIDPSEAVYVGDDPVRDVQGAAKAGWRTVWFNPRGLAWPRGLPPDAVVTHLNELEATLASL